MNNILKEYFDTISSSNRLSHAFLICNSDYDNLKEDLSRILSDYFFHLEIDIENCSDIYLIRPNNGKIVKEDILLLQENFKTKSQFNLNKVYIIDGVEKMNDYASNSLLKFLEEPEDNIYAFLITSNINKVLQTIRSRCQILMIQNNVSFSLSDFEEEILHKSFDVLLCLDKYKEQSVVYVYEILNKKEDKEDIKKIIRIIKYIYRDALNYLIYNKLEYFEEYKDEIQKLIINNDNKKIIQKLLILNKFENMLEYNLNINLFLDRLIIEMGNI
jgi:DNA polymerase-3 subunit delta'